MSGKRIGTYLAQVSVCPSEGDDHIFVLVKDSMGSFVGRSKPLPIDIFTVINEDAGTSDGMLHIHA